MKKTYLERVIIFGDPSNAHGLSADFFAGICLFPEHFIRFRIFISYGKMIKKIISSTASMCASSMVWWRLNKVRGSRDAQPIAAPHFSKRAQTKSNQLLTIKPRFTKLKLIWSKRRFFPKKTSFSVGKFLLRNKNTMFVRKKPCLQR